MLKLDDNALLPTPGGPLMIATLMLFSKFLHLSAARVAQSDRASDSYNYAGASEGCEFDPRRGLW